MNDNCYKINNFLEFINKNKDPKTVIDLDKQVEFLISEINKIHLALFSSISSLKVFLDRQRDLLNTEIINLQQNILNTYNNYIVTHSNNKIFNTKLQELLQDWVTLANRIDITERYLLVGNIMDLNNINLLFPLSITNLKNRPLNNKNFESLVNYQSWRTEKWNLCSMYGIDYLFKLEQRGMGLFEAIKKAKIPKDIIDNMVSFVKSD